MILVLSGCSILKNKKLKKIGSFKEKTFTETIPFKYIKGIIFVEVKIDNEPYNFILDTGAEVGAVSPELLSKISYKKQSTINLTDSNKKSKRLITLTIDEIGLGNSTFQDMWVVSKDLSSLKNYLACEIEFDGFIGSNLMRKAIWKIDYQKQQIEFRDLGNQFPVAANTFTLPMECESFGSAHINLDIEGVQKKFTFDTGATGFIQCTQKGISLIPKPNNTVELETEIIGLYGKRKIKEMKKKVGAIDLGTMKLEEKVISFVEKGSSVIGNEFWDNFNVIIDWSNCQLQLEEVKEIENESLNVFQYGFGKDIGNEKIYFSRHWKSHSLYQPIDSDHQIISIADLVMDDNIDFCAFIDKDFPSLLEREELKIVFLEKGQEREITLKKELLIGK